MPSFQHLTLIVVSILSHTLAAPAGGPQGPESDITKKSASELHGFSVKQVYNPNFSVEDGPGAWKKAAAKYAQSSPAKPIKPSGRNGKVLLAQPGNADTNAIDSSDLAYLTPITAGGKNYLLNFDTGSSNFWIGGNKTSARNKYIPTGRPVSGESWLVRYGDGTSASGDVFKETVVVGETTATAVAVGRATSAPASIFLPGANGQPGADGLFGLGFSSSNTFQPQEKTWMDAAVDQGLPNVFAANLMPGLIPGSFDFGQLNKSSYSGEIHYFDIVPNQPAGKKYWMVTPSKGDVGVMDTGSTLILLSHATASAYFSSPAALAAGAHRVQDPAQSYWAFNCNSTLPDFSIYLGGKEAVVPGLFLNYQVLENGLCYAAIQDRDPTMTFSIYGDRFLMTLYVVFDQRTGSPRIGFADKAKR